MIDFSDMLTAEMEVGHSSRSSACGAHTNQQQHVRVGLSGRWAPSKASRGSRGDSDHSPLSAWPCRCSSGYSLARTSEDRPRLVPIVELVPVIIAAGPAPQLLVDVEFGAESAFRFF